LFWDTSPILHHPHFLTSPPLFFQEDLANCNALIFSRQSAAKKTVKFSRFLSVKQSQPVVSREFMNFHLPAQIFVKVSS
jgi:hypothetical protein